MLQSMRSKASGIITWTIISLIVIAFSFVGINYFFTQDRSRMVAAKVGDEKIYWRAIEENYQNVYRQYAMRPDFDPSMLNPTAIKAQIRKSLIQDLALMQSAEKHGYTVGKEHLTQVMSQFAHFKKDGQFSTEVYYAALQHAGISELQFQNNLKKDILLTQLQRGLGISTFSTDKEKEQIIRLLRQKRDFGYVILSGEKYSKGKTALDKEIADYYEKQKSNYMTDEEVQLSYVELSLENLKKEIEFNDDDLKIYYEKNASLFITPEKVKVSHILIKAPRGSDKEKSGEALTKANDILAKIKVDGEKFEDLVKQYSDDKHTINNGGDIGWIGKNEMLKDFADLAFSLESDEIANEVIQTEFGLHILKVVDKKIEAVRSFDEVKDEISTAYKKEQADILLTDKSEDMANLAFQHGDSLDNVAASLNSKVKTSRKFSKKGLKVGIESVKQVIKEAFSQEVLNEGKNSDLIKISDDRYIVIRVNEHYLSKQKPLELVKDDIKATIIKNFGRKRVIKEGNKLLAEIKDGNNPNKATSSRNLKWELITDAPRGYDKLHYVIMQTVFNLPKYSSDSSAKVKGLILPGGDFAIVALRKVTDGKLDKSDETSLESMERSYRNHFGLTFGRCEYNMYQDTALKSTKISLEPLDF